MSGVPPPPPPPPPPGMAGGPPPPPPPGGAMSSMPVPDLPQINIPRPRSRMKTLQWQKIPVNNVIGKSNIWTIIGHLNGKYDMDYEKMDELFSINQDTGSKRSSLDDGVPDSKKKREQSEGPDGSRVGQINILDGKRSLNVNIFLKQFRMEHKEIVQLIRDGRCEKFGPERLKSLLKLLPSQEEIDAFNAFDGDRERLGNAEKFFLCLMKLPNYRMRIEGLLMMEEFNINMEWIRPSIEAVIQAARDIQENQSLKELIYLILISGNYLNSGNYAGNAAGFKLSSLLKLTEIRANKPRMNLMHYVAQEAEMNNPKLLKFPDEMRFLKDASQVSVETLTNDIKNIATKVRAITEQIVVAGADFQQQMAFFLKEANIEVVELEEDLKDIEMIREELAMFFCEDVKTFKLEECFRIMQTFCERLKKATEENIERRIQEVKAETRRKSKEMEHRRNSQNVTEILDLSIDDKEGSSVDKLLADVQNKYASRKFSDGNFSVTRVTKVSLSPGDSISAVRDMTDGTVSRRKKSSDSILASPAHGPFSPSDSLAQKRSRRSFAQGDDESLLDFLLETADSKAEPDTPESRFERYSSLRRRRLERKGRSALEAFETGRERVLSSKVPDVKNSSTDTTVSGVKMRHSTNTARDRPKSEIYYDDKDESRPLRRSQSVLDKLSVDKTNIEQRRQSFKDDDTDESDALIRRLKQKLHRKSGRDTPTINEEAGEMAMKVDHKSSSGDSSPVIRNNSRWRSGIAVSEIIAPTRSKSTPSLDNISTEDSAKSIEKTQDRTSNQLDTAQLAYLLQNIESSSPGETPKSLQNNNDPAPSISVSMRKQISSVMGTDIDGVLKTIEDTGRPIDTVGVTGPIKRTPEPTANKIPPQPQVAVVAHVTTSNNSIKPSSGMAVKAKKDNNKNISTLSDDKVKPTRILSDSRKDIKRMNNANNSLNRSHSSSQIRRSVSKPKTPPPPQVRLCKSRSKSEQDSTSTTDDTGNKKELNKTAKLTAKKKYKDTYSAGSDTKSGRVQGNIDSRNVDQALKETSSSNLGLTPEKPVVKRNSTNRLSVNGRRNGLYISDNESDTELTPEGMGTQGSSRCGSPEVFSYPSVNTSTETLQAGIHTNENESSPFHQPNNPMNSHNMEEESESNVSAVAKWKIKRVQQRRSFGDIIDESDSPLNSGISYASNDRDEGFETASGTMSQRTSMNSTLEAEIHNNPALSRLADSMKTKTINENNINGGPCPDVISPKSSPITQKDTSSENKTPTTKGTVKSNKTQAVPSYMLPTNSSASRPARNRVSSASTETTDSSSIYKRNTPSRTSVRDQESASDFKRDTVRASMRAETASTTFLRGTVARTSVRGPRSSLQQSIGSTKSTLAPPSPSRSRSESSSSISSTTSSTSNLNTASSSVSETTRRRLSSTSSTGAPIYRLTTPSGRPTTPMSRPTTPASQTSTPSKRPTITVSQAKTTVPPAHKSNGFTRTQSVRVTSGHTSSGSHIKRNTPTPTSDSRRSVTRSVTSLLDDSSQSTAPSLPERPHSTTPMSSEGKSTRRSSFMAPTASSRARADEHASTAPPRTQSLTSISSASSFTRHASLRMPNKATTRASGRKSPANTELSPPGKPEHYQSLSTVAEQTADEDKEDEYPKKSPFLIKKFISRSTISPAGSKASAKTSTTVAATKK